MVTVSGTLIVTKYMFYLLLSNALYYCQHYGTRKLSHEGLDKFTTYSNARNTSNGRWTFDAQNHSEITLYSGAVRVKPLRQLIPRALDVRKSLAESLK